MIDAIKNYSHTEPGVAWLHGSGCLACSNHRTGVLLSPTSYLPGVFTLLQTTAFQSQLDADSTKRNNNGNAIWFLKTKIRRKPTTQFICNNRIKEAPQGKNLEKGLESTAGFSYVHPHGRQLCMAERTHSRMQMASSKYENFNCVLNYLPVFNCCKDNSWPPKQKSGF